MGSWRRPLRLLLAASGGKAVNQQSSSDRTCEHSFWSISARPEVLPPTRPNQSRDDSTNRSKAEQPVKDDSPSKPAATELSATESLKPAAIDLKVSASSSSETAASSAPAIGKAPSAVRALPPKPKRPLSAFNLFYRYKRQKVLEALAAGSAVDDSTCALITSAVGEGASETRGEPPGEKWKASVGRGCADCDGDCAGD